ncbi:BRO-N domain-containing protein [Xylella fastidiosa]|jgi:prophage antirepressor-like protein|uniref:BRO-N domain-containing protein n=1 Tax=Xylella fastidiosa TaxID=2371 RepID=UPI000919BEF9|nr:BRO family protein [Xylella fastidiosa]SHH11210.1 BRO family, N-terminal domain [Xylella fastidiosa]
MTQLPSAVCFSGKSLSIIDRDGVPHLSARDLAHALGYADERSVLRIYNRHSEEFTYQMSLVVNLTTVTGDKPTRLFSPRGCHMVSMFARTSVAAAFRRWVLDVLEFMPSIRKTGSYSASHPHAVTLTEEEAFNLYALLRMVAGHLSRERIEPIEQALHLIRSPLAGAVSDLWREVGPRAKRMENLAGRCRSAFYRLR